MFLLHKEVIGGQDVVSGDLRFTGYLLVFAGTLLVFLAIPTFDSKHVRNPSALEVCYWVVNSVFFLAVLLVAAIR